MKENEKMKKDTRKLCDFHNISYHNNVDCRSKKSLVVEVKAYESNAGFGSKLEPGKWISIIDVEPSATIYTSKIHPGEPNETEEGEKLLHL